MFGTRRTNPVEHSPRERTVVDVDGPSAALSVLSSDTAQALLRALGTAPGTTSDLADRVDTSPQNVHYHLENLRDADLVTEVGTWYSSKGREMPVFGLTAQRLEIRLGPGHDSSADVPDVEHEREAAVPVLGD